MKAKTISGLICFLILIAQIATAQQTKTISETVFTKFSEDAYSHIKNDQPLNDEERRILNEITRLKNEDKLSNTPLILELQKEFEKISRRTTTVKLTPVEDFNIIEPDEFNSSSGFDYTRVVDLSNRGFATATEQRGSNAGRKWVVLEGVGISNNFLSVHYNDANSSNWYQWFSTTYFGPANKLDVLDMEIVETDNGTTFMYISSFYYDSNENRNKCYLEVYDISNFPTINSNAFELNWPSAGSGDDYYNIRVTTDNATFANTPWIYIVCSVDSLTPTGNHLNAQKFAYITNPYTTTPTITYRNEILPVFWPAGGVSERRELFSDVAYINDPVEENVLLFTYSNIPDSTKIWLTKSDFTGTNASLLGTLGSSSHISLSRIAATGGDDQQSAVVAALQNWQNSGDWDLVSFVSDNSGASWQEYFVESTSSTNDKIPLELDLISKKGLLDEYRLAYSLGTSSLSPADSVMFVKSDLSSPTKWGTSLKVNNLNPSRYTKAAINNTKTDDCLVIWAENSDPIIGDIWATSNCFSISSVAEDLQFPEKFNLNQNYPNPFNPGTVINFSLPVNSLVTLKVYDVLGNEVATLVNEEKPAGSYDLEFNSAHLSSGVYYYKLSVGNFSETKKMVLIK